MKDNGDSVNKKMNEDSFSFLSTVSTAVKKKVDPRCQRISSPVQANRNGCLHSQAESAVRCNPLGKHI